MFSSPYSPFFTSGLNAVSLSTSKPGSHHLRRGSLPDSSTSSSKTRTTSYYLSLQRRDQSEYRSFLSLDLAESRLSQRYGPQSSSNCLIPPVPALPPLTLPVVSPLKSHFSSTSSLRSADSLRSVPSPKPAPSIMLPKIPDPPPPPYSKLQPHHRPPILPELPILPALQFPLPPALKLNVNPRHPQRPLPSPPIPRSPLSSSPSPSPFSPNPTPDTTRSTEHDTPTSPISLLRSSVLTKPKHLRSKKPKNLAIITDPSDNRLSKASLSTVSTRVRRRNRWDALDALEGRRKPTVPPVPKRKKDLNLDHVFVNPSTFARPQPNPFPPQFPKSRKGTFMNMSDDSDLGPESTFDSDSSDDDSDTSLNLPQTKSIYLNPISIPSPSVDPLLEPEDIVLPRGPPPRPHPFSLNTQSYLDVDGDLGQLNEEQEEEEGVVLEATRRPAPVSPPPPVITSVPLSIQPAPQPSTMQLAATPPTQRTWISRVKGPVEMPARSKPSALPGASSAPTASAAGVPVPTTGAGGKKVKEVGKDNITSMATSGAKKEKEKDRTKSKSIRPSGSKHHHQHSSSRRHKASNSTSRPNAHLNARNNNHNHYKSFIELDMDDLLDQEVKPDTPSKAQVGDVEVKGVEDPEAEIELFEWRGRMGRGRAHGGGEWVWV